MGWAKPGFVGPLVFAWAFQPTRGCCLLLYCVVRGLGFCWFVFGPIVRPLSRIGLALQGRGMSQGLVYPPPASMGWGLRSG